MTFSVTLSGLFILAIITALLALYDGIARLRGRRANSVFAVIEIIAAALLALSQFVVMPFPLTPLVFSKRLDRDDRRAGAQHALAAATAGVAHHPGHPVASR